MLLYAFSWLGRANSSAENELQISAELIWNLYYNPGQEAQSWAQPEPSAEDDLAECLNGLLPLGGHP